MGIKTLTRENMQDFFCDAGDGASGRCQASYAITGMFIASATAHMRRLGWKIIKVNDYDGDGAVVGTRTVVYCPGHAQGRNICDHGPQHLLWNAQDGPVRLCKMTDEHLENAQQYIAERLEGNRHSLKESRDRVQLLENTILNRSNVLQEMQNEAGRREAEQREHALIGRPLTTYPPYGPNLHVLRALPAGTHAQVVWKPVSKGTLLNLDEETTKALYTVLRHVGGNPENTPRGLIDALYQALSAAIPTETYLLPWSAVSADLVEGIVKFRNPKEIQELREQEVRAAQRKSPGIRAWVSQLGSKLDAETEAGYHDCT